MKKIFSCLIMVVLAAGCGSHEAATADGTKSESPWKISRNAEGETVINVDQETQSRIGLKLTPLDERRLQREQKAFGQVVDPAALAAAVADSETARTAAVASQNEFARIQILAEQNNASARTLETARAAAERDSTQADAAHARLVGAWGKAFESDRRLRGFVDLLVSGKNALVRLDVPGGEALQSKPTGARLVATGGNASSTEAEFLGAVSSIDPQTQSQGFLFLVQPNSTDLLPGMAVTGYLRVSGEPISGVIVPPDAVLRYEGRGWVYVQTGKNEWTRREITLDHSIAEGWFVSGNPGITNQVVVVGAQQLLSEELKGQGGEE